MPSTDPARHRRLVVSLAGTAVLLLVTAATVEAHTAEARTRRDPTLAGRAVLPVETYAPGPTSGKFFDGRRQRDRVPVAFAAGRGVLGDRRRPPPRRVPGDAGQRVRRQAELAGLPDPRLLRRARTSRPPAAAPATVEVRDFIQFRDPDRLSGSRSSTRRPADRCSPAATSIPSRCSGAKQRRPLGGRRVRTMDPALRRHRQAARPAVRGCPAACVSPNNPHLGGAAADTARTAGASRPWRSARTASTSTPTLEGATVGLDGHRPSRRSHVYEFSIRDKAFTGRTWQYHTESAGLPRRRHGRPRPPPPRRDRA